MEVNNLKKRFIGNTSWMLIQRIYTMILSLVVGSLSARYLGPSNYGVINYGASIISFFSIICALGLDAVLVVEMVKTPEKQGSYIGTALVMRLIASIISFGVICFIVRALEPSDPLVWIVTELQAIGIIFSIYEVFLYWFQMRLEMKYVSIATIVSSTVTGVWRIILLATGQQVTFFSLTSSITALVSGAVVLAFFLKKKDFKLQVNKQDGIYLLSKSYHFIISDLAIVIYMHIDRIMLGKWVSNEAVGYYSAAATIATLWEFIPIALIDSARPLIVKKIKDDYDNAIKKLQTLLLAINILGVIFGLGILAFGSLAIKILYGEKYLMAVPALNILVWSTCFAVIGCVRSIWIVGTDKNKYIKYLCIIGALTNVILNAVFIPIWGITGAAIATLVSQMVVAIVAPGFFNETRFFISIFFNSFKRTGQLKELLQSTVGKKNEQ